MNTFHRLMDLWIEAYYNKDGSDITLANLVKKNRLADVCQFQLVESWNIFLDFSPFDCIFVTGDIRVVIAAFCSIALGIILSFAAKKSSEETVSTAK